MTFGYLNIYRIFDGILALLLNFLMFDNIMVMFLKTDYLLEIHPK